MPLSSRMMVFVDGENLVMRYQSMVKEGFAIKAGSVHETDTYVWNPRVIQETAVNILRVTYYTYAVGDDDKLASFRDTMRTFEYAYQNEHRIRLSGFVNPKIYKKPQQSAKRKGVDINIAVDALSHTFRNSIDIAYFITGDGDYLPLIEEVMRNGKQVYLAALSSGLHPELPRSVDKFFNIDHVLFALPG